MKINKCINFIVLSKRVSQIMFMREAERRREEYLQKWDQALDQLKGTINKEKCAVEYLELYAEYGSFTSRYVPGGNCRSDRIQIREKRNHIEKFRRENQHYDVEEDDFGRYVRVVMKHTAFL